MRHEVPLAVPDPFLYAERDGKGSVVASSFELGRINEVAPHLEVLPLEEFGLDELYAQGLTRDEIELEVILRAARRFGLERASVPATFPLEVADHLRANGIEVKADRELFIGRRPVRNEAELPGRVHGGFRGSDRKSTRLNSSHLATSYAVFCLQTKTHHRHPDAPAGDPHRDPPQERPDPRDPRRRRKASLVHSLSDLRDHPRARRRAPGARRPL